MLSRSGSFRFALPASYCLDLPASGRTLRADEPPSPQPLAAKILAAAGVQGGIVVHAGVR